MSDLTTITIDVYPWAVPSEEQKAMFDALSHDQQLQMIEDAIEEGFQSGVSSKTVSDILADVKARKDAHI